MTTDLGHSTRIVHTDAHCPNCPHGVGLVVRMIGHTIVVAQWPGIAMARREAREDVERYVAPVPTPVRRRRRSA